MFLYESLVKGKGSVKKICIVTTVPMAVNVFLVQHIHELLKKYEVTVVTNLSEGVCDLPDSVKLISVPISRDLNLFSDVFVFGRLIFIFLRSRFDAVISVTPKAGLLSSIAGLLSLVPIRIHWFTGQVWATKKGWVRYFLKLSDRMLKLCLTDILVDSQSQLDFLVSERVLKKGQGRVLASGSISGVDLNRFRPSLDLKLEYRKKLNIPIDELVILFLGRLNFDKGVLDLINAFEMVSKTVDNLNIVFVGPDEGDYINLIKSNVFGMDGRVHFVGKTSKPECWLNIADIVCLPSYREGFGSVIIEASAVGLPAVVSRVYGLTDAVVDGVTGLMHEPGDIKGLSEVLKVLLGDDCLRSSMGLAAFKRAHLEFDVVIVVAAFSTYINSLFFFPNEED